MVFTEWTATLGEKALSFQVLFAHLKNKKKGTQYE
jgi:hypothetical protein